MTRPDGVCGSGCGQGCEVCGQEDLVDLADPAEVAALEADIASRRDELKDAITAIDSNLARMRAQRSGLLRTKDKAEADINRAIAEEDSAFLSMSLLKERERAALEAELASIAWLLRLPLLLQQQREALAQIVALEQAKREALREARTKAEADRTSLNRFAERAKPVGQLPFECKGKLRCSMKILILAAGMLGLATLAVPMEASAVVCARGVVRAGCVGPNGAVVARRPAPRAVVVRPVPVRCAIINGRRVCR